MRLRLQMVTRRVGLICLVLMVCSSCYPKRVGLPGPDGKPLRWPEMNVEQRKAHMARSVLPWAAAIFGTWRPDRFGEVDCRLCHGLGTKTGNFSMPTAHLPRLSGDLLLGPEFSKHPETTWLKLDRLVPAR